MAKKTETTEAKTESNESKSNGKAAKFSKLAGARVTRTLNAIRQIGNLSNRASYEFKPEHISKIFGAIREETAAAEERFTRSGKSGARTFSLD